MGVDIRKKRKVEKTTEFVEKIKKVQEEVRAVLRKSQEEIKRQANKKQREVEEWRKSNKIIQSTKNLVFEERPMKKLTERYIRLYIVEEAVSKNVVKLKLLASMRIHLVMNISRIVRYREQVEKQKVEEVKLVKVDRVEEWKIEIKEK